MSTASKGKLLKAIALCIDVGVPVAATLSQFPIWVNRDATSTMSGLTLVLVALACIPFYRQIREYFKSPSAPVLWFILFLAFTLLESIASEIKIVCFWGAIANVLGSAIYKLASSMTQ